MQVKLPENVGAEQAILGALLLKDSILFDLGDEITADDFADLGHQAIFRTIESLVFGGKRASSALVRDYLGATDPRVKLDEAYLDSLTGAVASLTDTVHYARQVADLARRRRLMLAMMEGVGELGKLDPQTPSQSLIDRIESEVLAASRVDQTSLKSLGDWAGRSLARVMDAVDRPSAEYKGLSWGITAVDNVTGPLMPGKLVILGGRPGAGKAQPLTSKVLLSSGQWREMGRLEIGDPLASVDGKLSHVTAIHPRGTLPVFRVAFSDGRSTRASGDHLWRIWYRDWDAPKVVSTNDLAGYLSCKRYQGRLWVDICSGRFGSGDELLPLEPWALGVLLGHGELARSPPKVTSPEPYIVDRLRSSLEGMCSFTPSPPMAYRLVGIGNEAGRGGGRPNPFFELLRSLGLNVPCHEVFVPPAYLSASRDARVELLRGILDTNGYAGNSPQITVTSYRLAEDVVSLVRSLGGLAAITEKQPTYTYKNERLQGRKAYVVNLRHDDPSWLFSLPRKVARLESKWNGHKRLTVASVKPDGHDECQCISVSHPLSLYVTDHYVVTHNSALAGQAAEHFGSQAPGYIQSLEMEGDELAERMMAQHSDIAAWRINLASVNEAELDRLQDAVAKLRTLPVWIDHKPRLSIDQVRARAIRYKHKFAIKWMVLDHIHICRPSRQKMDKFEATDEVCVELKQIAKDLRIGIVALAQLNKEIRGRDDGRPRAGDLLYYSAIEPHADSIIFTHRPEIALAERRPESTEADDRKYQDWKSRYEMVKGKAEIINAKRRSGKSYETQQCAFIAPLMQFRDLQEKPRKSAQQEMDEIAQ